MNTILISLALVFVSTASYAANFEKLSPVSAQWVAVDSSTELYVEYYAPQENKETVVLLHGLTYTTRQWKSFINELRKRGLGVVTYDMRGMGQSLLKYAPIKSIIPITNQADDLKVLLRNLNLPKPYNIIGLSYGGGVGFNFAVKFPKLVKNLILMAPYTKPLEKVDTYIKSQVAATRLMNPLNPFTDDEVYEFYFRQFVYATYPMQEPIVLENPYKLEAVFRLSQGIGAFIPMQNTAKLKVPTHLMIAEKDQYFPVSEFEAFWNLFPAEAKASLIYVKNSEHKIPEAQPAQAADYVQQILE